MKKSIPQIIVPKIIKDNCLDFVWSNEKLWKLKLPVTKMSIKSLKWQFDIPFWKYKRKIYTITPNQVLFNPKKYKSQYKRMVDADLRHPIDIMKNHKNKWEALDGLHRLAKAKLLGHKSVNVRKIPKSKMKDILR